MCAGVDIWKRWKGDRRTCSLHTFTIERNNICRNFCLECNKHSWYWYTLFYHVSMPGNTSFLPVSRSLLPSCTLSRLYESLPDFAMLNTDKMLAPSGCYIILPIFHLPDVRLKLGWKVFLYLILEAEFVVRCGMQLMKETKRSGNCMLWRHWACQTKIIIKIVQHNIKTNRVGMFSTR